MLQDGGHCGCVPGGEGTSHPETRQCTLCGKLEEIVVMQLHLQNPYLEGIAIRSWIAIHPYLEKL